MKNREIKVIEIEEANEKVRVCFNRKCETISEIDSDEEKTQTTIKKFVEISDADFNHFAKNLQVAYSFIKENNLQNTVFVIHSENCAEEIIVDCQGFDYARYVAIETE